MAEKECMAMLDKLKKKLYIFMKQCPFILVFSKKITYIAISARVSRAACA